MSIFRKHPFFSLCFFTLLAYSMAEIIIRGDALNRCSCGVFGWIFWGAIAFLIVWFFLIPLCSIVFLPPWQEPNRIDDSRARRKFLEHYARVFIRRYRKESPDIITHDVEKLTRLMKQKRKKESSYEAELMSLVTVIHTKLAGPVCDDIIKIYMKRASVIVAVSQRGIIDALAMLVMQIRMIIDLCKALGYKPSWIFVLYCLGWIAINSFIFAILEENDVFEDCIAAVLPITICRFLGKFSASLFQGITAMAVVYSTGKIIQILLLNQSNGRLTKKERIRYRADGYKEALKFLPVLVWNTGKGLWNVIKSIFSGKSSQKLKA